MILFKLYPLDPYKYDEDRIFGYIKIDEIFNNYIMQKDEMLRMEAQNEKNTH